MPPQSPKLLRESERRSSKSIIPNARSSANPVHMERMDNNDSRLRRVFRTNRINHSLTLIWPGQRPRPPVCQQERRQRSRGDLRSAGENNLASGLPPGCTMCFPIVRMRCRAGVAELFPPADQRTGNRLRLLLHKLLQPARRASAAALQGTHFFYEWFDLSITQPPQAA